MEPNEMKKGFKYLIVHQVGAQRFSRMSLMTYLGANPFGDVREFDARPAAGTQKLLDDQILAIAPVADQSMDHYVNKRASSRIGGD
jgi:hypothetical protein